MHKRTYLDTGVLIAAFRGVAPLARPALQLLDDPERTLLVSDAVRLESLPKARCNKQNEEVAFYEAVFDRAVNIPWSTRALKKALEIAGRHGLAAMDAIHVAHALRAKADEFVTTEKPASPLFRVRDIRVRSIHPVDGP